MQNFYFTFGSDPLFPYQNTYLIIKANNLLEAAEIFRTYYPDRSKNCLNCAFYYTEAEWEGSENEKYYGDPVTIIGRQK